MLTLEAANSASAELVPSRFPGQYPEHCFATHVAEAVNFNGGSVARCSIGPCTIPVVGFCPSRVRAVRYVHAGGHRATHLDFRGYTEPGTTRALHFQCVGRLRHRICNRRPQASAQLASLLPLVFPVLDCFALRCIHLFGETISPSVP